MESNNAAEERPSLEVTKMVKFFPGDEERRAAYMGMEVFRDRWTSDSHFIRAACQHYMKQLDKELKVR